MRCGWLSTGVLMFACQQSDSKPTTTSSATSPPSIPASAPPATKAELPPVLPFTENDFDAAIASAKKRGVPVFVDVWATWCHTCLSMKHYVFTDPALAPLKDELVFVAIDTDRAESEGFVERYSISVWPTLFVIDSTDGSVVGAWPGSASARELQAFIRESLDALDARRAGTLDPASPTAKLIAAKDAQMKGQDDYAAKIYADVVESAPAAWSRRSEALVGRIQAENGARRWIECAAVGAKHLSEITGTAMPTDFARYYSSCVGGLPKRERAAHRNAIIEHLRAIANDESAPGTPDDRADTLDALASVLHASGDRKGATATQERRVSIMERAARSASSPHAAQTFDAGLAHAYLDLGRPERAVSLLERRERELSLQCQF